MVTNSLSKDGLAGQVCPAFPFENRPYANNLDINKFLINVHNQCSQNKQVYNYIRVDKKRLLTRMSKPEPITVLLQQWQQGNPKVLDVLSPLIYQELHRIAKHYMRGERKTHTLQPTALINEAFIKLLGSDVNWHDRKHFFAVAARQMRHILVDYARAKDRKKRGADYKKVTYEEEIIPEKSNTSILELDDALYALKNIDQRKHDMVELYYFGGLDIKEIASHFELSSKTIQRELRMAEAWLQKILSPDEDET
jgi:RNA polymerase sigma factor (TIGR02999 family)